MIISNEMWQKLKEIERELLRLKQKKNASCESKYYTFTVSGQYSPNWQITYKSGDQAIITEVIADAITSLSTPSNNRQYIFCYAQYPATITVLSTREIVDIVAV